MKRTNLLERVHNAESNEEHYKKKSKKLKKELIEVKKENAELKKNLDSF